MLRTPPSLRKPNNGGNIGDEAVEEIKKSPAKLNEMARELGQQA